MELFGMVIPLWALLLGVIILAIVVWKLIKFAVKILIVVVVFLVILVGLDFLGVFSWVNEHIISLLI